MVVTINYNILKDKLAVNHVDPKDRDGFIEGVKGVWQYYVDEGYFTWEEINQAIAIAGK
jgi:C4-dicarboxylate-binding protein DctP